MAKKDPVIRDLLRAGHKFAATNLYRQRYGGGQEETLAALEKMESEDRIEREAVDLDRWDQITDVDFRDAMEGLLREGRLVSAIQLYRAKYPAPLRFAKRGVLAWGEELGFDGLLSMDEETVETFDIRWRVTLHPQKQFLVWKQAEAFFELRFDLQVADQIFEDDFALSWWELAASEASDGEYGIFTCGCGDMGCGGFSAVEVVHLDGRVLWYDTNNWTQWHVFEEDTYLAAISRFDVALLELTQSHPTALVRFYLDFNNTR